MKYPVAAFDLETTGLNPRIDQVLQIGCVLTDPNDRTTPVEDLPTFTTLVYHRRYHGDAGALAMNSRLLKKIDERPPPNWKMAVCSLDKFIYDHCGARTDKPHPMGFNVGSFDVQFFPEFPRLFHRRSIELGTMFCDANGIPSKSSDIVPRFLDKDVAHDALEDAQDAVRLYRLWLAGDVR